MNNRPSGDSSPPVIKDKRLGKRRKMVVYDDEFVDEEANKASRFPKNINNDISDEEEQVRNDVKPIGNVVRVSGEGESRRNHYKGFETDGVSYELKDTVLVNPEEYDMKPSVAMIKDISETREGKIMVIGRRFYRPEIAEKEDGGNWGSKEERELFYSFDEIEFKAESVLHKCHVHFVPPNKTIPNVREYPGFFVEKVYDAKSKRLSAILDIRYGDSKQHEIFELVQKTINQIPNWPIKQ